MWIFFLGRNYIFTILWSFTVNESEQVDMFVIKNIAGLPFT